MQMREAMPLHRVQAVVCVSGCVNDGSCLKRELLKDAAQKTQNPRCLLALRGCSGSEGERSYVRLRQTGTDATAPHGTTHTTHGNDGEAAVH
jgi:hypothetical protein